VLPYTRKGARVAFQVEQFSHAMGAVSAAACPTVATTKKRAGLIIPMRRG
jgi:hypothetical protein